MNNLLDTSSCSLCPRECGVDRRFSTGFCGCGSQIKAARAALHLWEEPCLSGTRGSGTIFFSGCTLKCCFCQNHSVSTGEIGKEISPERLGDIFLSLQEQGAHNINLVTPTQYLHGIIQALDKMKHKLFIPVVYNCGGYEKTEVIDLLEDYVDIYLPDLKYYSPTLSRRYSRAENYFEVASKAIFSMIAQKGKPVFDENGLMKRGVILRHMVLPGQKEDSITLLKWLKENLESGHYLLSLLSQYTPFYKSADYPEINRRITTYEYNKVLDTAIALGLTQGYMQEKSSAKEEYTPPFDLEGL